MITDQATPEYWNECYNHPYQDNMQNSRKFWKELLDKTAKDMPQSRILDIGCGIGDMTDYLRQKGHIVMGIDYSTKAIETARERYPLANYNVCDINDIIELSRAYKWDIIIAFEVLEHFPNPLRILYKIMKSLRHNGMLIFSIPHKDGKFGVWHEHYTLWDYNEVIEVFGKFWDEITFYKVNSLCDKTNIFGIAKRGGK